MLLAITSGSTAIGATTLFTFTLATSPLIVNAIRSVGYEAAQAQTTTARMPSDLTHGSVPPGSPGSAVDTSPFSTRNT